jgi:hypothetical protein
MVKVFVLTMFLFTLEISAQTHSREYWKVLADDSQAVVVGIVEEDYRVIRPEKYKPNPDGSSPTDAEIYIGRVFRVRVLEKLKGKIKTEKIGKNKYVNIFLSGANPTLGISAPRIFKGEEYVLFLELNKIEELDEKLKEKQTIEFSQKSEIISIPFDYKTSYSVVRGFHGAVEIKTDEKRLIKEIKRAID